ncbi:MAG: hypothetical protein GX216_03715 [Methanomicrobiales archaeon]|mgnify:CR=1 FL=1|nr:hypothetical protein [Methanomicrobiales archaeon]
MDDWAAEWLAKQRKMGKKCLEIKYIQGKPYVYHSTSVYDQEAKKPRKVSRYIGRLTQDHGLLEKGSSRPAKKDQSATPPKRPPSVCEYGNAHLLAFELQDLIPVLAEAFPGYWPEIVALLFTRITGNLPLTCVEAAWEKLDNPLDIQPDCSLESLSAALRAIDDSQIGQEMIFEHLCTEEGYLIYDISFSYSLSDNLPFGDREYDADDIALPRANLALFSGRETGLPAMLCPLPDPVEGALALLPLPDDLNPEDAPLIFGRRSIPEEAIEEIINHGYSFLLPLPRDSIHHKTRIHLDDPFTYRKRLIRGGKKKMGDRTLYLFMDEDLRLEERKAILEWHKEGIITEKEAREREKLAGRFLFLSNLDETPQEIYELYRTRDLVERYFDTLRGEIQSDALYLGDQSAVYGHLFVGFLRLYLYCRLLKRIRVAGLEADFSPEDLLRTFSKVMKVSYDGFDQIAGVSEDLRGLEERLGVEILP